MIANTKSFVEPISNSGKQQAAKQFESFKTRSVLFGTGEAIIHIWSLFSPITKRNQTMKLCLKHLQNCKSKLRSGDMIFIVHYSLKTGTSEQDEEKFSRDVKFYESH